MSGEIMVSPEIRMGAQPEAPVVIPQESQDRRLKLPGNLNKALALTGSVLALAGANFAREAVFTPDSAYGNTPGMECTNTITPLPDGTTETREDCSSQSTPEDNTDPNGAEEPRQTTKPSAGKEDKQAKQKSTQERREERKKRREARRQRKANSQKGFKGYNMEDTSFTDKNGCFITAAASSLRRETGNAHITPRKIYHPALRKMWSPGTGVKGGFLFTALDEMAATYNVKVGHTDKFKAALRAKKNGDEVILRAGAGHFTDGGHYMAVKGVTKNGKRIIIDDPNGKGKYGDSERKSGWNGKQLSSGGVLDYHILHLRGVR